MENVSVKNTSNTGFFYSQSCVNQKDELGVSWAKSDGRSQAGGVVWFLGKAKSEDYVDAFEKAEELSVSRLVKECGVAHESALFHERCINKVDNEYLAYTRLSIKQDRCSRAKHMNETGKKRVLSPSLDVLYKRYLKRTKINEQTCSSDNYEFCLKEADQLYVMGKKEDAFKKVEVYCDYSKDKISACRESGYFSLKRSELSFANLFFLKSCMKYDYESCAAGVDIAKKQNDLKFLYAFNKYMCVPRKSSMGCVAAGKALIQQGEKLLSIKEFKIGCDNKDLQSCFFYGLTLWQRAVAEKDTVGTVNRKLHKKGLDILVDTCDKESVRACEFLASILDKLNLKKNALIYRNKACSLGSMDSCSLIKK